MSAKETFEKLAPAYKEAYLKANKEEVRCLEYKNGWVYINGNQSCRAKQLEIYTNTLLARAKRQEEEEDDLTPIHIIKTKITFRTDENNNWTEAFLGEVKVGHYLKRPDFVIEKPFFVYNLLPVNYTTIHDTEEDAKQELIDIANIYISRLNEI